MFRLTADNKLRTFNNYLNIVVILLGVYIILMPFIPQISFWVKDFFDDTNGYRYQSQLATDANIGSDKLDDSPEGEWLVIPDIQVDESIVVGDDPANIDRGVWHRPNTSTPDQGGNTVLVGHRFSYNSPATFYHLDKMQVGDRFAIWWQGEEYIYEVFDTLIVEADAIEIENNTEDPIATLYTCTPVWTAEDRLVIRANLVNTEILEEGREI